MTEIFKSIIGYKLEDRGYIFNVERDFLFTINSRPAVERAQPPNPSELGFKVTFKQFNSLNHNSYWASATLTKNTHYFSQRLDFCISYDSHNKQQLIF
jgi:hypothetical protein